MFLTKVTSNLIFSKKSVLDLVLLNYLVKLDYAKSKQSSNHFVSLKSPFHYKLGKNHLNINSIKVDYYVLSWKAFKGNTPLLGLITLLQTFKKVNYKL